MEAVLGMVVWIVATCAFLKVGLEALGHFSRRDEPNGEHGSALLLGIIYTVIGISGIVLPVVMMFSKF